MPQTKPMLWSKFLMSMAILLSVSMMKMYHMAQSKKNNMILMKSKYPLIKW